MMSTSLVQPDAETKADSSGDNNNAAFVSAEATKRSSPLVCIMVIGFHHKKGCQLEYAYPDNLQSVRKNDAAASGELYTLAEKWRHLPSLALPVERLGWGGSKGGWDVLRIQYSQVL